MCVCVCVCVCSSGLVIMLYVNKRSNMLMLGAYKIYICNNDYFTILYYTKLCIKFLQQVCCLAHEDLWFKKISWVPHESVFID